MAVAATVSTREAYAHDADVVFIQLTLTPGHTTFTEVVTLTAGTLGLLAPVDADGDGLLTAADLSARAAAIRAGVWDDMPLSADAACLRGQEETLLREGYIELRAVFACPQGKLRQELKWLSLLPANYSVVLKNASGTLSAPLMAQGAARTLSIPRPGESRPPPDFFAGARGGWKHPLALEHLCMALLLACLYRKRGAAAAGLAAFVSAQWVGQWAHLTLGFELAPAWSRALEMAPFLLLGALAAELWLGDHPRVRLGLLLVAGLEHGVALPGSRMGTVVALTGFGVAFAFTLAIVLLALWFPARALERGPRTALWSRRAAIALSLGCAGFGFADLW